MVNLQRRNLSVRIAVGNISKGKGSGVLFLRNNGDSALVFSVAHLFDDIDADKEVNLFLDVIGDSDKVFGIHDEKFRFYDWNGDVKENLIIIPKDYDKNNLENDIAIIVIKWQDWMNYFQGFGFSFQSNIQNFEGWGFPAFMQKSQEIDVDKIPELKAKIQGIIENITNEKVLINYVSSKVEEDITVQNETAGFSGTALFCEGCFVGCISKSLENSAAGSRLYASHSNQYMKLMKELKLAPRQPNNLIDYGDFLLKSIPTEKTDVRNYVDKQIDSQLKSGNIKPDNYFGEGKTDLYKMPCIGFREICREFWKGELIAAFCFVPLKNIEPQKLPCFNIEMEDHTKIRVVFVCTESKMSESIQHLMDYSYFNSPNHEEDGVLFLWNNKEDPTYYNGALSKTESKNIVRKITEGYLHSDIKKISDGMNMFHIIDGDRLNCNIASIGIGQIWNSVLNCGGGNEELMKRFLDMLIEGAWR